MILKVIIISVAFTFVVVSGDNSLAGITNKIIEWVSVTPSEAVIMRPDPVGVEYESNGVSDLFLCRGFYNGYYFPGKLRLKGGQISCIFGNGGQQITTFEFQILKTPPGTTSWIPYLHNEGYPNAVIGARLWDKDIAYICRAKYGSHSIPGFMHTYDNGACNIAIGGKEVQIKHKPDIELLVTNNYGRQYGVTQPMRIAGLE